MVANTKREENFKKIEGNGLGGGDQQWKMPYRSRCASGLEETGVFGWKDQIETLSTSKITDSGHWTSLISELGLHLYSVR